MIVTRSRFNGDAETGRRVKDETVDAEGRGWSEVVNLIPASNTANLKIHELPIIVI